MPKIISSRQLLTVFFALLALNLAWAHQTILSQEIITIKDYYAFEIREPILYRLLPALIYRLVHFDGIGLLGGLNAPLATPEQIFQLLIDSLALFLSFLILPRIVAFLHPKLDQTVTALWSTSILLLIVVFGFFMVPNRALFYPYDFTDLCLASLIFYLCVRADKHVCWMLPLVIFVAAFNKETALFYSGMYPALHLRNRKSWSNIAVALSASAIAFVCARLLLMFIIGHYKLGAIPHSGTQYEMHLSYTLQQFRNPLFMFAMLNVCSYLYIPVIWLAWKNILDGSDWLIIAMVITWFLIMSTAGVIRELRLFAPASLMLFVILTRHLGALISLVPNDKASA